MENICGAGFFFCFFLSIYLETHIWELCFNKELVQSELNTSPEHQKGEDVYILKMILMTSVSQQVLTFALYLG